MATVGGFALQGLAQVMPEGDVLTPPDPPPELLNALRGDIDALIRLLE